MSKSLIPAQRWEIILDRLAIHGIVRLADLRELLDTSEATIRRDLEKLEEQGLIERTHGGAILSQHLSHESDYQQRRIAHQDEKIAIGALAAGLIEDGDIVFVNSGTTTTQLIKQVRGNANITIVTNNLAALMETDHVGVDILLVGGQYQRISSSVAGRFASDNLRRVFAAKTFIGVDGFSYKYGCTIPAPDEAELVRVMIERTLGDLFLLADHSKWGIVSNHEVARINTFQYLISDQGLEADALSALAHHGLKILLAPPLPRDERPS